MQSPKSPDSASQSPRSASNSKAISGLATVLGVFFIGFEFGPDQLHHAVLIGFGLTLLGLIKPTQNFLIEFFNRNEISLTIGNIHLQTSRVPDPHPLPDELRIPIAISPKSLASTPTPSSQTSRSSDASQNDSSDNSPAEPNP